MTAVHDQFIGAEPYRLPVGDGTRIVERCHAQQARLMRKGSTGCAKTRFVEYMAWRFKCPLITISCHDDLADRDLVDAAFI